MAGYLILSEKVQVAPITIGHNMAGYLILSENIQVSPITIGHNMAGYLILSENIQVAPITIGHNALPAGFPGQKLCRRKDREGRFPEIRGIPGNDHIQTMIQCDEKLDPILKIFEG